MLTGLSPSAGQHTKAKHRNQLTSSETHQKGDGHAHIAGQRDIEPLLFPTLLLCPHTHLYHLSVALQTQGKSVIHTNTIVKRLYNVLNINVEVHCQG